MVQGRTLDTLILGLDMPESYLPSHVQVWRTWLVRIEGSQSQQTIADMTLLQVLYIKKKKLRCAYKKKKIGTRWVRLPEAACNVKESMTYV